MDKLFKQLYSWSKLDVACYIVLLLHVRPTCLLHFDVNYIQPIIICKNFPDGILISFDEWGCGFERLKDPAAFGL